MQVNEIENKRTSLEKVVPLEIPYIIYIDPCVACNFKNKACGKWKNINTILFNM